jgi:hypothetical protein
MAVRYGDDEIAYVLNGDYLHRRPHRQVLDGICARLEEAAPQRRRHSADVTARHRATNFCARLALSTSVV